MTCRRGFTLPELVVTVAMVGLLLVVLLPRMSGTDATSQDRAAQAAVDVTLDTQVSLHAALSAFAAPGEPGTPLETANPDLDFVPGSTASTRPGQVSVAVAGMQVTGAALGGNDVCWFTRRDFNAAAAGRATLIGYLPVTGGGCTADAVAALAGPTDPTAGTAWSNPWPAG